MSKEMLCPLDFHIRSYSPLCPLIEENNTFYPPVNFAGFKSSGLLAVDAAKTKNCFSGS
jgi:hypothetical protein